MDSPSRKASVDVYQAGDLTIDVGRQTVNRAGVDIPLPRLSFDVLVALAEAHPRMLSIEELMESVWAPAVVNAETVSQRILLLRHALGDQSQTPRYIVGVRGRGYRFDAPVSKEPLPTPRGVLHPTPVPAEADKLPIIPTASARPAQAERFGLRRIRQQYPVPGAVLTLLGAMLVIVGSLLWFARRSGHEQAPGTSAATIPRVPSDTVSAPPTVPERSIAVLPFVDMSEQHDQEYFADGLTDELIELLANAPDLRVPARTSSFFFKGQHASVADIAKALNVSHLLEGSVRKSGHTIRITVQLIRADNGYHVWSNSYDRDIGDVFKVQDEIAAGVADTLKARLTPTRHIASRGTSNTEAYDQFLLGRKFHDLDNDENYMRSITAYRRSITLDPKFAAAYAGLAMSEADLADSASDAVGFKRAAAAAEQAIALAPEEADGYAARGYLRTNWEWDWMGAKADFSHALALDPENSQVQRRYGQLLGDLGLLPDSFVALKKATALDPLSHTAWITLGYDLLNSQDLGAAHEALRRGLEIQPDESHGLYALGRLQMREGKAAEALATFRRIVDIDSFRLHGIAMAEHTLGHNKASQQALDKLIATDARGAAYQIAVVCAWRGARDKAFEWLERAYLQRDGGLADIKIDAFLADLRGDPRYKALLIKMNLPV